MICARRWSAVPLALWLMGLACSGTPLRGREAGTDTIGTGGGGTTAAPGGATSSSGGATSFSGGMTASSGSSATGGTSDYGGTWGGTAPSCIGLTAPCGPSNESCCTSLPVPGGTFYRGYDGVDYKDPNYPATVDDFYLDKYEITVGRFRAFVNAGMGTQASPPTSGAGAHPLIAGSGWDPTWNLSLPVDTASLKAAIECEAPPYQTWTDTAGSNESRPQNCLDWFTAFAFCAWDGGRLPTDAERNYAASGGSEQRYYPWSSPPTSRTIDDSYLVSCGVTCPSPQNVGSKSPKGDGKWSQSDLAGNVSDWTLDWYASPYPMPCDNCADLITPALAYRVYRGGGRIPWSASRDHAVPQTHDSSTGSRCARSSL